MDGIDTTALPSGPGCVECEAAGGWYFHLRRCAQCGHIGCCDSSPSGHATAHAVDTGNPVLQSYELGEEWFFHYVTEDIFEGPELAAPQHHPLNQTVPGPRERVPENWQKFIR